jgi:hypothetical protein
MAKIAVMDRIKKRIAMMVMTDHSVDANLWGQISSGSESMHTHTRYERPGLYSEIRKKTRP